MILKNYKHRVHGLLVTWLVSKQASADNCLKTVKTRSIVYFTAGAPTGYDCGILQSAPFVSGFSLSKGTGARISFLKPTWRGLVALIVHLQGSHTFKVAINWGYRTAQSKNRDLSGGNVCGVGIWRKMVPLLCLGIQLGIAKLKPEEDIYVSC